MKIDFSAKLIDFRGNEVLDPSGAALTIGNVAVEALLFNYPDEQEAKTKLRRYELAARVHKNDTAFGVEEVAEIKTLIGKVYAPVVVGCAFPLLDGG